MYSYLLNNISKTTWALSLGKLEQFESVLNAKFINGVHFPKDMAAFANERRLEQGKGYEITNGKAIIPIEGALMRKASFMDAMSGFSSMGDVEKAIKNALADPNVNHLVLDIDSPGGTTVGTQPLSDLIFNARSQKRVTALVQGSMYSAALWIGTAADEVYSTATVNGMGSIGVYLMHVDQSASNEMEGLKVTYVKAGRYKAIGNPDEPLSADAIDVFQREVDKDYSIFIDEVARNRGVSREYVIENWADAQLFNGQEAVDNGLIDGIVSFDELINS